MNMEVKSDPDERETSSRYTQDNKNDLSIKMNENKLTRSKGVPQVAIKPKPAPVTVLPKPSTLGSHSTEQPYLNTGISLKINTSKRWILPPRPRPGRKPTSAANDEIATGRNTALNISSQEERDKKLTKKKAKVLDRSFQETSIPVPTGPKRQALHQTMEKQGENGVSNLIKEKISEEGISDKKIEKMTPGRIQPTAPNAVEGDELEMIEVKKVYLSKLKEQELIRNYIEVIDNQIKELNFVQNGLITFDALSSESSGTPSSKPNEGIKKVAACEQLEKINNMNDLNKFLGYLMKSTDIIRSVTKSFIGNEHGTLNDQIKLYLGKRSSYKAPGNLANSRCNRKKSPKSICPTEGYERMHSSSLLGSVPLKVSSSFTPSLLRPLNQSSVLESDEEFNELWKTEDLQGNFELTHEDLKIDKLILKDEDDPLSEVCTSSDLSNAEILPEKLSTQSKASTSLPKKPTKLNCGFCVGDGPCLCLEIDNNALKSRK